MDARKYRVRPPGVLPQFFVSRKLVRIEVLSDALDFDVAETGANRALLKLCLSLRNDTVKFHLERLSAYVGPLSLLSAERTLQPNLLGLTIVEYVRDGLLQPKWHLVAGIEGAVAVLVQSHHCPHERYLPSIPPRQAKALDRAVLSDLRGFSDPFAPPTGR